MAQLSGSIRASRSFRGKEGRRLRTPLTPGNQRIGTAPTAPSTGAPCPLLSGWQGRPSPLAAGGHPRQLPAPPAPWLGSVCHPDLCLLPVAHEILLQDLPACTKSLKSVFTPLKICLENTFEKQGSFKKNGKFKIHLYFYYNEKSNELAQHSPKVRISGGQKNGNPPSTFHQSSTPSEGSSAIKVGGIQVDVRDF